jgi:translation initiation factor 2B subunit (eIF-2B alpha/beta/delta family)
MAEHLKAAGPPRTLASPSATVLGRWPQARLPEGIVVERHVLDLVPASLVRAFVTARGSLPPDRVAAALHPCGQLH